MAVAEDHTRRGIEFCGLLGGRLDARSATFSITTLLIHKQRGTSDQVTAEGEEEIFVAKDSRDLFPLGWIHTHQTQTCFLSSIDIHTQCEYQRMLDEALAIVMAPNDAMRTCGVFRLTTPGGMQLIQKCEQRGFHPHGSTATGQPIYDESPHVVHDPNLACEVVDLRAL